VNRYNKETLK